jgi:hypothetical protein
MLEYLVAMLLWSTLVLAVHYFREDLHLPMLWSALSYAIVMTAGFWLWRLASLFTYMGVAVVPGYWSPPTLFNLGRLTGGFSIEGVAFMLIAGAVCGALYPLLKKKGLSKPALKPQHLAPVAPILVLGILQRLLLLNLMHIIILYGLAAGGIIWVQRRDLIRPSLFCALAFLCIYFGGFVLFNKLFPHFLNVYYNFSSVSALLFFEVPLEELAYAFTMGLAWGPMYPYLTGRKYI